MDGQNLFLPVFNEWRMGYITKKDISKLAEIFIYRTVDNFQTAEDMAKSIMQLSHNRNLLKHQYKLIQYIAASVWLLAHKAPVPVNEYESNNVPVKYRSCLGDLVHLIVFLSYKPKSVISFLQRNERVVANYPGLFEDLDYETFVPLAANMNRMIMEDSLLSFRGDEFSFRVSKWAVTPIAKPVPYSTYDLKNLSSKSMLIRCTCDIRACFVEEIPGQDEITLETLGARFRALRHKINMTQKVFAEQIGITKLAYLRMESGHKISAEVLMKCLVYYSRIINLDVLFDKRIWELAQMDQELLFKKVHMSSVVHRKHQLLKESLNSCMDEVRVELTKQLQEQMKQMEELQKSMEEKMNILHFQFDAGINSILALTDE